MYAMDRMDDKRKHGRNHSGKRGKLTKRLRESVVQNIRERETTTWREKKENDHKLLLLEYTW